MVMKRSVSKNQIVTKVITFLNLGFKDYVAARVLLNIGLCLQGVILASTCIEKHFKAIITFRGNTCDGHLRAGHLKAINNYDSKLYASLNVEFQPKSPGSFKLIPQLGSKEFPS